MGMNPIDVDSARDFARDYLREDLPRRWTHVRAVAAQAALRAAFLPVERRTLIAAAWLPGIGYSPRLIVTGFHPLDGARFLRAKGWDDDVCALVANHTCARVEAERRGLGRALAEEFPDRPGAERDALWTADATTGPDGQPLSLDERVAEVIARYGEGHVVAECMRAIRPELDATIARTRARVIVD